MSIHQSPVQNLASQLSPSFEWGMKVYKALIQTLTAHPHSSFIMPFQIMLIIVIEFKQMKIKTFYLRLLLDLPIPSQTLEVQ